MVIAIINYTKNSLPCDNFLNYSNVINSLIQEYSNSTFVFVSEDIFLQNFPPTNNVIKEGLPKSKVVKQIFYKTRLKSILKKHQVEIVLNFGNYFKHPTLKVIAFLQNIPKPKSEKQLLTAVQIIVNTNSIQKEIIEKNSLFESKVRVIYPTVSEHFKSLNTTAKEQVKDGYADGRFYFLLNSDGIKDNQLINVLKAFSQFKKWQKTNMKLIIANRLTNLSTELMDKMNTYKYKDDIVLAQNIPDEKYALLLGASYCFLHLSNLQNNVLPLIEAIKTNTTIISHDMESNKEIAGKAAIYINSDSISEMSNQLQSIYKDEILRGKLIKETISHSEKYDLNNSVKQFWDIITSVSQE